MSTASDTTTIYSKFGIPETATGAEIETAFRRMATQYHPSQFPDDDKATTRFQQLANAFFVLSNANEKERYDAYLRDPSSGNFRLSTQPPSADEIYTQVVSRRAIELSALSPQANALFAALREESVPQPLARQLADVHGKTINDMTSLSLDAIELPKPAAPVATPVFQQVYSPATANEMARSADQTIPTHIAQPYLPPQSTAQYGSGSITTDDIVYAGFWERYAALILDTLLIMVASGLVFGIIMVAFGLSAGSSAAPAAMVGAMVIGRLLGLLINAVYFSAQEGSSVKATLGKRAVGIQVVTTHGDRISTGRAIGRWFAHGISDITFGIGYIIQPFNEKKQALHDLIAGTVVIRKPGHKGNSGLVITIVVIAVLIIPVIGILAAIAIPQYAQYQHRGYVKSGMTDGRNAVTQLLANHEGGKPFPAKQSFPHSQGIASVEFDRSTPAVAVEFAQGDLKGKTMYVFPSAQGNKLCFALDGETSPGINNCATDEPSALVDAASDGEDTGADNADNASNTQNSDNQQ